MKARHWITAIVLLLLVGAIVGIVMTRDIPAPSDDASTTSAKKFLGAKAAPPPLVDQRPLQTARRMAAMAGTPEEQALAHEAEKVADHEVDLAFFDALRTAQQNPPPLAPAAKEVAARKTKAELTLKEDQENIAQLTRKLAAAPDSQKDNLQDQIDVAKAQMDLDQDELDDASKTWNRRAAIRNRRSSACRTSMRPAITTWPPPGRQSIRMSRIIRRIPY